MECLGPTNRSSNLLNLPNVTCLDSFEVRAWDLTFRTRSALDFQVEVVLQATRSENAADEPDDLEMVVAISLGNKAAPVAICYPKVLDWIVCTHPRD